MKLVELVADAESEAPAEVVHTACGEDELVFRTDIEGELEGEVCKVSLKTSLTSKGETNTVVDAIAHLDTRTGKPTQPIGNLTLPLIDTSQIEEIGLGFEAHA